MAKKGGKKKGKKKQEVDPNMLTEVDKTFYELQITDLNRKLARLRALTTNLEDKNTELKESVSKVEEDSNDVIIFLKRSMVEKSDEIKELQDKLTDVEEKRQVETVRYEQEIQVLKSEYVDMHETLTSKIKLLEGKVNSLEEFRGQRDELMRRYGAKETAMEEQEVRHKHELYEIERKFIIAKDNLKKEMESRLLQLSTEFSDATEMRIAATTHRVIRENVAINNELDLMLNTHNRLYYENKKHRRKERTYRQDMELREEENKTALAKIKLQTNIIERLASKYETMKQQIDDYKGIEGELHKMNQRVIMSEETIFNLKNTIRVLEQNLHSSRVERAGLKLEMEQLEDNLQTVNGVVLEAVMSIKAAIMVSEKPSEGILRVSERDGLLKNLLNLLDGAEKFNRPRDSVETVPSLSKIYAMGDLGFVPVPVILRSEFPVKRHAESQVSSSFETFLPADDESVVEIQKISSVGFSEDQERRTISEATLSRSSRRQSTATSSEELKSEKDDTSKSTNSESSSFGEESSTTTSDGSEGAATSPEQATESPEGSPQFETVEEETKKTAENAYALVSETPSVNIRASILSKSTGVSGSSSVTGRTSKVAFMPKRNSVNFEQDGKLGGK